MNFLKFNFQYIGITFWLFINQDPFTFLDKDQPHPHYLDQGKRKINLNLKNFLLKNQKTPGNHSHSFYSKIKISENALSLTL